MSDQQGAKAISAVTAGDVTECAWSRSFVVKGSTGTPYVVSLVTLPGIRSPLGTCTCKAGATGTPCWHVRAARLMVTREQVARERASGAPS
jgi:hypothetical protein